MLAWLEPPPRKLVLTVEVQAAERQLQENDGFFNEANTLERHAAPQLPAV